MNESSSRVRHLLWVIDIDYSTRHHHGAMLRFRNYSKQLIAGGWRVYWLVHSHSGELDREREFFSHLRDEAVITDFFECIYAAPVWQNRLASLSIAPALGNRWLATQQRAATANCRDLIQQLGIDICILSSRKLMFLVPQLRDNLPVVIDFIDSMTLYHRRECEFLWQNRDFAGLLRARRYLAESRIKERYYARIADANIVVSPVDKQALDQVSGTPEKNHVLLNGVSQVNSPVKIKKVPGRLIFSGNMDFPPNYKSALWFIDEVFPMVLSAHPDAELVIAGANPVPELLGRASGHVRVTGFVEDMSAEIAASSLYIAPMIMGGGFKNKVVEALMNRTYVAGTRMAVEFLGPDVADSMLVADTPEMLAQHIVRFLSRPEEFQDCLDALHSLIVREFSWERRTAQLVDILGEVFRARSSLRELEPAEVVPAGR